VDSQQAHFPRQDRHFSVLMTRVALLSVKGGG
jgi:hypothetical protein